MFLSSHSALPPGQHRIVFDYPRLFSFPRLLENFQRRFSSILFNSAHAIRNSTSTIGLTYASFGHHLRSFLSPFSWLFSLHPSLVGHLKSTPPTQPPTAASSTATKRIDNLFPTEPSATVDPRLDGASFLGTAKPCATNVDGVQYIPIESSNGVEWILRESSFHDFNNSLGYEDMAVADTPYFVPPNVAQAFTPSRQFEDGQNVAPVPQMIPSNYMQQSGQNYMDCDMGNENGMLIPDHQPRAAQYSATFSHSQSQSPPVLSSFASSTRHSGSSQSGQHDGSFYIPELSFTPSSKDGNSPGSYEELLLRDAAKMSMPHLHRDDQGTQNIPMPPPSEFPGSQECSYIAQEIAPIMASPSDESLALSELYSQMFGNDMLHHGRYDEKFSMPISQTQPNQDSFQNYEITEVAENYPRSAMQSYDSSMLQNYTPGAVHSDCSGVDSGEEGMASSLDFPTDSGGSFMSSVSPVTDSHSGDENVMHKCPHCGSVFKVKGYLTRHIKKHALNKAYTCPFFQSDTASSCHKTGGFSRRDTYKIHLKTRHFVYPPNTELKERNNVAGNCGGCGRHFANNEEWITDHIEINRCPGVLRSCSRDRSMHTRRLHIEENDRSGMQPEYHRLPSSVAPV